jgi:hypothetical protein
MDTHMESLTRPQQDVLLNVKVKGEGVIHIHILKKSYFTLFIFI